tara:strand:+ start:712 stop:1032 length:321 start_codon:yes stop_codon:yes gene_type:complete
MGQYTDKINKIAEDFKQIEDYETVSSLLAQTGVLVISFRHGGYEIRAGENGGNYNGYKLGPNEVKIVPSTEKYYLELKQKYDSNEGQSLAEMLGVWKKKFNNYFKR